MPPSAANPLIRNISDTACWVAVYRARENERPDRLLDAGGVPFKFSPEEGPDFFVPHGWKPITIRSMIKTAAVKKRINFFMRLLAKLPDPKGGLGNRPWGGSILLEKSAG